MNNSTALLYTLIINASLVFISSQGMDLGLKLYDSQDPMSDFSQSSLFQDEPSTSIAWESLAKPSYLEFYTSINEYLLNKNKESLKQAQKALPKNFDNTAVAAIPVYKNFLENASPDKDMIDKVKIALNNYYFRINRNDLCKSIPFFLEAMLANNNKNTKQDILRVLKQLGTNKHGDQNAQETIASVREDISKGGIDRNSINKYLNLLDEVCHFFPEKNFKKASEELTEYQLMDLLKLGKNDEKRISAIAEIDKNINTMIDFIKPKSSSEQVRIQVLNTVKKAIQNPMNYTDALAKELIEKVDIVTEETLKPKPRTTEESMESSSIGMQKIQEKRNEYKTAQQQVQKKLHEEQEKIKNLVLDDVTMLLTYPTEIVDYINSTDWTKETKISFLQLLFWHAHIKEQEITAQAPAPKDKHRSQAVKKELRDFMKALRDYETGTEYHSLARITHDEDGLAMPYFTFPFDTLPENTPQSLKTLFDQYQQKKVTSSTDQSFLAIDRLYKGINVLKEILKSNLQIKPLKDVAKEVQEAEYGEKISKTSPIRPESRDLKLAAAITKEFVKETTTEKQQVRAKSLSEKQQKYHATRSEKISELSTADPEKLKREITERINKKQEKMEALISAEITKLEKSLPDNKDTEFLSATKTKLQSFKTYALKDNVLLKKRILLLEKRIQKGTFMITKSRVKLENVEGMNTMDNLIAELTEEIRQLQPECEELQRKKEEIISAEIIELEKFLLQDKDKAFLNAAKARLQNLQAYVLEENKLLQNRIQSVILAVQRALYIIRKNQINPKDVDDIKKIDDLIAQLTQEISVLQQTSQPEVVVTQPVGIPAELFIKTDEGQQKKEASTIGVQDLENLVSNWKKNPDPTSLTWNQLKQYDTALTQIASEGSIAQGKHENLKRNIQDMEVKLSIRILQAAVNTYSKIGVIENLKSVMHCVINLSEFITYASEEDKQTIIALWKNGLNDIIMNDIVQFIKGSENKNPLFIKKFVDSCKILNKNISSLFPELGKLRAIVNAPKLLLLMKDWKENPDSVDMSLEKIEKYRKIQNSCTYYEIINELQNKEIGDILKDMALNRRIKDCDDAINAYRQKLDSTKIMNLIRLINIIANNINDRSIVGIKNITALGKNMNAEYQLYGELYSTITDQTNAYLNEKIEAENQELLEIKNAREKLAEQVWLDCEKIRKYDPEFPMLGTKPQEIFLPETILPVDTQSPKPLQPIGTSSGASSKEPQGPAATPYITEQKPLGQSDQIKVSPPEQKSSEQSQPPEEPRGGGIISNIMNGIVSVIGSFFGLLAWPFTFISSFIWGS